MDYIFGPSGVEAHKGKKLQIRVGTSLDDLQVTNPNADLDPHFFESPYIVGLTVVRVKSFDGIGPLDARTDIEYTVDDILFGSQFERKCSPPLGSGIALKFASLIDPAIQSEIYTERPWVFSPLLCSMNVVNVLATDKPIIRAATAKAKPKYQSKKSAEKNAHDREKSEKALGSKNSLDKASVSKSPASDTSASPENASSHIVQIQAPDPNFQVTPDMFKSSPISLLPNPSATMEMMNGWPWRGGKIELEEDTRVFQLSQESKLEFAHDSWADRRKYFQKTRSREDAVYSPGHIYNFEIYAPFIDLTTFDLSLGININLCQYLNNQPLRMMCKSLSLDKYLFVVEFSLVDDPAKTETKKSKITLNNP